MHADLYKDGTIRFCSFCESPRKDSSSCNIECLVARWAGLVSEPGLCLLNRSVGGLCLEERKGKGFCACGRLQGCVSVFASHAFVLFYIQLVY
jgi:hypothetical protein